MLPQQYCLRWKYHHSNLQTMFSQLLDRGCFCDVTLACEGQTIKAHRVVLCACSTYFDQLLTNCSTEKDPIIIMRDAKFSELKCLVEFMYKGEINVEYDSLSSLLKTASELRIKGLAEVSWRDGENPNQENNSFVESSGHKFNINSKNTIHNNNNLKESPSILTSTPTNLSTNARDCQSKSENSNSSCKDPNLPLLAPLSIATSGPSSSPQCASPVNYCGNKKKRGRPPLDEEYDSYTMPKIAHVETGNHSGEDRSTPFNNSSQLVSVMMEDNSNDQMIRDDQMDDSQLEFDEETIPRKFIPKSERPDTPQDYLLDDTIPPSPNDQNSSMSSVFLTEQEQAEWKDVIKMNDYLTRGRRPQFWEEPFTKRVMDGIKNKNLEMKKAAKLLGVSYGTLYGRYRETYGCLKHPYRGPFMVNRMRDIWPTGAETGTTGDIISMLQRGAITLPRAAELMNTTPSTISNYLDNIHDPSLLNDNSDEDQKPQLKYNLHDQIRVKPEISISYKKQSNNNNNNHHQSPSSSSSGLIDEASAPSMANPNHSRKT